MYAHVDQTKASQFCGPSDKLDTFENGVHQERKNFNGGARKYLETKFNATTGHLAHNCWNFYQGNYQGSTWIPVPGSTVYIYPTSGHSHHVGLPGWS